MSDCCHKASVPSHVETKEGVSFRDFIHCIFPLLVGLSLFVSMRLGLWPTLSQSIALPWEWVALATILGLAYFGWPFLSNARKTLKRVMIPLALLVLATVLPLSLWPGLLHSAWIGLWGGALAALAALALIQAWRSNDEGINAAISLALCVACGFSCLLVVYTPLQALMTPHLFFHSVWILLGVLRLGKLAKDQAGSWQGHLLTAEREHSVPERVWTYCGSKKIEVKSLEVGKTVLVKCNERSPVDGYVRNEGGIDVLMGSGDRCHLNKGDTLQSPWQIVGTEDAKIEVDHDGSKTRLNCRTQILKDSLATKPPLPTLVDKAAQWIMPILITVALSAAIVWGIASGLGMAIMVFICVLLSACPCVLFLATPIAGHIALKKADESGMTFKSARDLLQLAKLKTLICDQNGTLTYGSVDRPDHAHQNDLRPGVEDALKALKILLPDLRIVVCTGSTLVPAIENNHLFTNTHANQSAIDKQSRVRALSSPSMMIGDGDNDAEAIAAANIGVAMRHAIFNSQEQAQAILPTNDWAALVKAVKIAQRLSVVTRCAIGFACLYNAVLIPLAAGGAYFLTGAMLSPIIAGIAMTCCSLVVVSMALFGMQYGLNLDGLNIQPSALVRSKVTAPVAPARAQASGLLSGPALKHSCQHG